LTKVDGDELGTVATIQGVVTRARSRGIGCSRRAREHELAYRRWRFWSGLLGVLTAIGSAVAASALLLGDGEGAGAIVCGIIALLAAAFATVNTSFLQSRVEENRTARAAFTSLRSRYHLLRDLPPKELPAVKAQFEDIERGHAQAEIESPPPEEWARQRRISEEQRDTAPPAPSPAVEQPPSRPEAPVTQTVAVAAAPRPVTAAPAPARTAPRPNSR
jgi:hypothetical protein